MTPRTAERVTIDGPAGLLEIVSNVPESAPRGIALVAHPHPLQGGTLDNKVAQTLARTFFALGYVAVRFNFRGVGASAGAFDEGNGETEDALAALAADPAMLPAAALVPLASRVHAVPLFEDLLRRASDADLAPAMTGLLSQLPAPARADWLRGVAHREGLGSLAVLSAQPYLADPAIATWLRALLDVKGIGASAAQALSASLSLDQWLDMAADPQESAQRRQHAVLAIRLRNDAHAEQRLRALAQDGKLPAVLVSELLR